MTDDTADPRHEDSRAAEVVADEDHATTAARLAVAVGRINRRVRTGTASLSYGLLSALATVVQLGPIRPSDLARAEVVTKPTMTRVLVDLESRGFIEREDDPTDGRAFVVSATTAGVDAVRDARAERAELVAALLAGLGPEDVVAIEAALDALERVARVDQIASPA
jgi:DNA-binding MarR family transcriptional regulator